MVNNEDRWFWLRLDYLRERATLDGTENDFVAFIRDLLSAQRTVDGCAYADEAATALTTARSRFPNSVAVWEHTVLHASLYGSPEDTDAGLRVLGRLDPDSLLVKAAVSTDGDEADRVGAEAQAAQSRLLADAGSPNPDVVEAAIAELRQWVRSFPFSSIWAINLGLGLMSAGRTDDAIEAARSAIVVEDGSFADAYNLALVLGACGAVDEGEEVLRRAASRAQHVEEQQMVHSLRLQVFGQ